MFQTMDNLRQLHTLRGTKTLTIVWPTSCLKHETGLAPWSLSDHTSKTEFALKTAKNTRQDS